MHRWVLHIDMDAFFASCEQLTRPTLRGRPVLVGGLDGRGVVAGSSYEARAFGATSAMPVYRAANLVGASAVLVRPRRAVYQTASQRVFDIIAQRTGVVEQLSIDEAFLEPAELVGAGSEQVRAYADELRLAIATETGLPSSVGAGPGKQSAKIGSGLAKPAGTTVISAADHDAILHPLAVGKLWGAGPVTQARLKTAGVETIGDLAAMSRRDVEIALGGANAVALWQLARGNDEREVIPRGEAKQISAEHTYPKDLVTTTSVDEALDRAARQAHARLLTDGRGARTVTVKLKMADFHTESRSATLPYATDDREQLTALAQSLVRYPGEVGPIRLVGVGFSGLEADRQDVLFSAPVELDLRRGRIPVDLETEAGVSDGGRVQAAGLEPTTTGENGNEAQHTRWQATQDIRHEELGHGWVQGCGHGVVSVRFETRSTGPGPTRTFAESDPALSPADPVDSLDWQEWLSQH